MSYNPDFVIGSEVVRDHVLIDPLTKERKRVQAHVEWAPGLDSNGWVVLGSPFQCVAATEGDHPSTQKVFTQTTKVVQGYLENRPTTASSYPIHHKEVGI